MLLKIILSYFMVYTIWGSTYYFIKLSVATIPPMYVVGFRFLFGGIGLILYALFINLRRGRKPLPNKIQVLHSVIIGILLLLGGNGMVTISEKRVDSYIAALIISIVPIIVLLFDRIILGKRLSSIPVMGAIIGITGTGLLLYRGNSEHLNLNIYILLIFTAAISWALGTTLSKKLKQSNDVILNTGIQSFVVGIVSIMIWNNFQPVSSLSLKLISTASMYSLLFLIVIGSVGFCAYSFLLKHEPNQRVVSYALVNPVIAVFIGIFIGKEPLVPYLLPSLLLILAGLCFLFYGEKVWNRIWK